MKQQRFGIGILILCSVFLIALLLNLALGSVIIPLKELGKLFLGSSTSSSFEYIMWDYRFPKALAAIVIGGSLGVSGLLMQTFFRNPLAGPFVLGISSGASLGVALLFFGSGLHFGLESYQSISRTGVIIASSIGSGLVFSAIFTIALRVKNTMGLLIIGLMFGSFTTAIVTVLSTFSSAEILQRFVFWTYGNLGNLKFQELQLMTIFILLALGCCVMIIKALNSLLLGENYAQSMGIPVRQTRFIILFATCLLTGASTAFAGPIGFVGLAVPHIVRLLLPTSEHRILLPAVFIMGGCLLLLCDTLAQLPGLQYSLPINGVTSMVGAPLLIWLILRKRKIEL